MITKEEAFLNKLKELCKEYGVNIVTEYKWVFDGKNDYEVFSGMFFHGIDIDVEISNYLLERIN